MYANVHVTGIVTNIFPQNEEKTTYMLIQSRKTINSTTNGPKRVYANVGLKFADGYEVYTGKIEVGDLLFVRGFFVIDPKGGPAFSDKDGQPHFIVVPHRTVSLGKVVDPSIGNDEFGIVIAGNLGKDPEMRFTNSGDAVTNLNVATTRKFQIQGAPASETTWWRVSAWRKQAEVINEHFKKGNKILIEASINYDEETHNPKTFTRNDEEKSVGSNFEVNLITFTFIESKPGGPVREQGTIPDDLDTGDGTAPAADTGNDDSGDGESTPLSQIPF